MTKLPKLSSNSSLLGLSSEDLEEFARQEGEKSFRGRQIHEWIYQRGAKKLRFNKCSSKKNGEIH